MVLDIVNIFNNVTPAMWSHKYTEPSARRKKVAVSPRLEDDSDGTSTMNFLGNIEDVAELAVGPAECSKSLGLDQGIYAYGQSGKFIPAAYIASFRFVQELESKKQLIPFTLVRERFEDFLLTNKGFLNALTHSKGSRTRSLESILKMHRIVCDQMRQECTDYEIVVALEADPALKGIRKNVSEDDEDTRPPSKKFSPTAVRAKPICQVKGSY